MSMQGLSDLVVTIMTAGDVAALDALDPRAAHEALLALHGANEMGAEDLLKRFRIRIESCPDPDVGRRVTGLTRALWDGVNAGMLEAVEDGHRAWYAPSSRGRMVAQRELGRLPADAATAVYRVGAAWAARSTSLKYAASASGVASSRALSRA